MGEEKSRQTFSLQFIQKNVGSSQIMIYAILVVLLLAVQIMLPGYLKSTYVTGILKLASFMRIAVIEQNLTILTGGIDLSIANTITPVNVIAAQIMMGRGGNLVTALLAVIVMGVMVGFINGVGTHWLKISPLVMTLGVSTVIQGVFLIHTKGAPKGNAPPLLKAVCGQGSIGILSGIVVIRTIMVTVAIMLLRNTPYGRKTYPVGTNGQAARFSEIHTGRVTFSVYLISAIVVVVFGFFLVGYTGTSFLDVSTSYNTKAIAAVVIGGATIAGGKGGYIGTVADAIVVAILGDSLTIVNISEAGCQVIQGVTTVLLVLMYSREGHRK